ncbi:MAG TPA: hypothetical protein VME41_01175 [Stellaceae bacterium]|nr:hypothetical protein [Stellaceae bacterium]
MASAAPKPAATVREAVASFADREHFRAAVAALLAAGFEPADLSVLASHESLRAVEENRGELIEAGLTGEVKYIDLLTDSGIILISGGPIAIILAALIGAGVGGAALKEFFADYMAAPHRDAFSAALKAGSALLWVRCADGEQESRAARILDDSGGRSVHIHERAMHEAGG